MGRTPVLTRIPDQVVRGSAPATPSEGAAAEDSADVGGADSDDTTGATEGDAAPDTGTAAYEADATHDTGDYSFGDVEAEVDVGLTLREGSPRLQSWE